VESHRELLSGARLSLISAEPDRGLDRIARLIQPSARIAGPVDLERLLDRLLATGDGAIAAARTLDLIGHSTSASQLRLGRWVIDARRAPVIDLVRALAARRVLPRLGIRAVRLLGCRTASTAEGRFTICALAEILGVEVYGTDHLLHDAHYDERGLRSCWEFLLVGAAELRRRGASKRAPARTPVELDVAVLPARPLGAHDEAWPRRVVTADGARRILALVRRDAGGALPAALAPSCELALPADEPGRYHVAHVLLDGAFLRFYPHGESAPGVAYPVDDAPALRHLIGEPDLDDR
jgi:hypothetical protein